MPGFRNGLLPALFLAPGRWAWGHPGHGSTVPDTPAHYLLEPEHAWWIAAVAMSIAAWSVWKWTGRASRQRSDVPANREQFLTLKDDQPHR